MENIRHLLEAREEQLMKIKKEKEISLASAPEGTLRVCSHGNRMQYFLRNDPKDFSGSYIGKKDRHIAQALAQKDYDEKVLKAVGKELKAIRKYLDTSPETCAEDIYEKLHKARKELVHPLLKPESQYVKEWKEMRYQGKSFYEDSPIHYTGKDERVRSKSEVMIADQLAMEGIPYHYEHPMDLKGWGVVYPDFTILDIKNRKEVYWEHLGRMDDSGYAEMAVKKIDMYEQHGIYPGENLILTYETKKYPLNLKQVQREIQKYLK